jgi:hypothetical protein
MPAPNLRRPNLKPRLPLALALLGALGLSALNAPSTRAQDRTEFVPTFSTSPRVKQQLDRLGRLAQQKQWDPWLAAYQQLVDDRGDAVLERDAEFLVGVRYHCHQILAGLPAPVRQRYRALYDNEARRLFERAAAAGDGGLMRDVYSRYRFSSFGDRALLWLADRALDSGQAEMARIAYSRVVKSGAATPALLLRLALAASGAGRTAEAKAALDRVRTEFGQAPLQVRGEPTTGAAAAAELSKALRAPEPPVHAWPTFAGAGDRRMTGGPSGELKLLWEYDQPVRSGQVMVRGAQSIAFSASSNSPQARFGFLTFPVVRDGRVWLQGPLNVTALDLATGATAWERQDLALTRDEVPNEMPSSRGGLSLASRPVQTAPSAEGRLLAARLPMAAGERDPSRWPADFAIGIYDSRSGRPLWRRVAGGTPRGVYFNLPTLQANAVVTGVVTSKGGITEYNAVALDAGSGEPLWSTYLGAGSDSVNGVDGSPAAVRDGIVWIESSLYTLNALDLITGEVRLIYHYTPPVRPAYQGGVDSPPPVPNEPVSLVAAASGPIVFAPRWGSDAVAIDPQSGKLLWSAPKAPGGRANGVLFGADAKRAYICGEHIQALNLSDGSRDWLWDLGREVDPVGYAALAGDRIYVMIGEKLYIRSAADGHDAGQVDLLGELGGGIGYTSLVVVDNTLLLSTRDRVVALGPK